MFDDWLDDLMRRSVENWEKLDREDQKMDIVEMLRMRRSPMLDGEREEAAAEIARLRSELDLARTGQMMSIQDLQAWREADHADAITLHRNFIIVILTTLERLRADKEAISQAASGYLHALTEIACYDDEGANARLARTGRYSSFDEPSSVQIARGAIE